MIILFFSLFLKDFLLFHLLLSSLLFSSLLSSLLFSSLFSCHLLLFSFFFFFFSLSSSLFSLCLLSLSSFSVFFLRVLVVCVSSRVSSCVFVCVVWCGVVCRVVWHAENPVCRLKNASVCRFKTSPCMPATRAHAFQHVRVVPVHTGTF